MSVVQAGAWGGSHLITLPFSSFLCRHTLTLGYSASDFLLRLVSKDGSVASLPPSRQQSQSDLGHSLTTATTTTATHNYSTTQVGLWRRRGQKDGTISCPSSLENG
jgi:hypothetical protein